MKLKREENDLIWETYNGEFMPDNNATTNYNDNFANDIADAFENILRRSGYDYALKGIQARIKNNMPGGFDPATLEELLQNIGVQPEDISQIMSGIPSYGTEDAESKYGQLYSDEETVSGQEDAETIVTMQPLGGLVPEIGAEEVLSDDEDEDDNEIVLHSLRKMIKRAECLLDLCSTEKLETWMIAKIIKAEDYISDVWDQLDDKADFANDGVEDSDNISL